MNNNTTQEGKEDDYVTDTIMSRIKELYIDCPECENMWSDEQYQCGTCGGQGAGGNLYVFDWLKNNKKQLEK